MRLIVHGQQAFGKSVLEALLERGEDVVSVYCAPDKGSRLDPLKELAQEQGIPVHQPSSFKDPAVWEQMRALEADLCIMAYVTLFVPEQARDAPRLGSIQYHPSLLPLHKGPSSINWPIIFGETKTGLTIFWPDDGLDTGPILLQKDVEIGEHDTLGTLYFNQLFPLGVAALLEGLDRVRDGTAPREAQDPDAGSYEGWCRQADVEIDWSRPIDEVYNLVRGANPQPGAWTSYDGKQVQVFDCKKAAEVDAAPGTVVDCGPHGVVVAAAGGSLLLERVRPEGGAKLTAAEFADQAGLSPGARLGR